MAYSIPAISSSIETALFLYRSKFVGIEAFGEIKTYENKNGKSKITGKENE